MSNPAPVSGPDPTKPDRYPGTPGWVKAVGVIAVIVALVVGYVVITGVGGPHGPQRHGTGEPTHVVTAAA